MSSLSKEIFLDIKGFKFINDFYGHENGDFVLQTVAERIKHSITTNSFLARIGADEFVIILNPTLLEAVAFSLPFL